MRTYSVPLKVYIVFANVLLQNEGDLQYYLNEIEEDFEGVFYSPVRYCLSNGKAEYTMYVSSFKDKSFWSIIKDKNKMFPVSPDTKVRISGKNLKAAWETWKKGGDKIFDLLIRKLKAMEE